MGEHETADADIESLLVEHVRTLADLHEIEGEQTADPAIVEAVRRNAEEAEVAYLRARDLPSTEG